MSQSPIFPEALRARTVTWHDPSSVAASFGGLSGLQIMQRIRDGELPPPPMASLIGFRCVLAEPGEIGMQLEYDHSLENSMGMLHGATAAAMLDTAMGAAAHTMLPVGSGIVTSDLTMNYLRPVTPGNAPITAVGTVVQVGRKSVFVTGEVRDRQGRVVVHAVGNFAVLPPPDPKPRLGRTPGEQAAQAPQN